MVAFGRAGADHHKFDFSGVFYLPAMLLGSALGLACFKWLNDRQFALAVNILLIVAGASFLI